MKIATGSIRMKEAKSAMWGQRRKTRRQRRGEGSRKGGGREQGGKKQGIALSHYCYKAPPASIIFLLLLLF